MQNNFCACQLLSLSRFLVFLMCSRSRLELFFVHTMQCRKLQVNLVSFDGILRNSYPNHKTICISISNVFPSKHRKKVAWTNCFGVIMLLSCEAKFFAYFVPQNSLFIVSFPLEIIISLSKLISTFSERAEKLTITCIDSVECSCFEFNIYFPSRSKLDFATRTDHFFMISCSMVVLPAFLLCTEVKS